MRSGIPWDLLRSAAGDLDGREEAQASARYRRLAIELKLEPELDLPEPRGISFQGHQEAAAILRRPLHSLTPEFEAQIA